MCTIGYGDISPKNIPEIVYVMIIVIIGCCVFGYALNTIGTII